MTMSRTDKRRRTLAHVENLFRVIASDRTKDGKMLRNGLGIGLDEEPKDSRYFREKNEVELHYANAHAANVNRARRFAPDRSGKTFSLFDRRKGGKAQDESVSEGDDTYDNALDTLGNVGESVSADNSTERNEGSGSRKVGMQSANEAYARKHGSNIAKVS